MIRTVLVAFGLVIMHGVNAQSLNIDLDEGFASPPEGGGAPSSAFGAAAGQAGFWNSVSAVGPRQPLTLRGLDGSLTSVTMLATGGVGSAGGINFSANTGDYARLLNDFADIGDANTYTFAGLTPGDYIIYSYAVAPSAVNTRLTHVEVSGSIEGVQNVTGPMPGNTFAIGITHTVHHVHNLTGSLIVTLSSSDINAKVNGFQIVAVPEPASILVCSLGVAALLRKKGKQDLVRL